MDPDVLLDRIRKLIPEVLSSESTAPGDKLAEAVKNLDEWLSNGGFLPQAWSPDLGQLPCEPLPEPTIAEALKGLDILKEFKPGESVQIIIGGPHENLFRTATVGRVQDNGDVVVYFGDQDEDEWVYSPHELKRL